MSRYSTILVDIDPNHDAQPALLKALDLCHHQPTTLILCVGVYYAAIEASHLLDDNALTEAKQHIIDRHQLQLAKLQERHKGLPISYVLDVQWHTPLYEGIIQAAIKHKAELIIKSTGRHPLANKIFFTPSDWQLLKASPVPVLLTRGKNQNADGPILACVDPMHKDAKIHKQDQQVLNAANTLARMLDTPVYAGHCFDPDYWQLLVTYFEVSGIWSDSFPLQQTTTAESMLEQLRLEHLAAFDTLCDREKIESPRRYFISGPLSEVLPELIEELSIGTVVVGSHYRTGLLGSTAEWLLESVECDLLAVKPLDFVSPVNP